MQRSAYHRPVPPKRGGTRFQFAPYRGGVPAIQDLVAGQIDLAITDPIAALPQVHAGTIKAYGVTAKTRLVSAPDIPTLDEAGLPGFDISLWHGLWVPKGTPKNIVAKLNAAVMDAFVAPTVRARLADLGQEIFPPDQQTPGGTTHVPKGGDREVVADHQGRSVPEMLKQSISRPYLPITDALTCPGCPARAP
jgi:hypothetical protein